MNVDDKVKKDGGRVQYGWVIWYTPGVLMEAEFHAIWVSPHGEHVDVSRHVIDIDTILFLPDPTRTYTGRQVDNVRIPVSKDPRVKEFIHLHESLFKVKNEGDLAKQNGAVIIPEEKIKPILLRIQELSVQILK